MKLFKRIVKAAVFAVIILTLVLVLLRSFLLDNTGAARDIIWTEEAKLAYESDPDNFHVAFFDADDPLSGDGRVAIVESRYIDNTKQVEFTVRYRDSNFGKIKEDLGFSRNDGGHFEYGLFITTKEGIKNVTSYVAAVSKKLFYNYERLVFGTDGLTDTVNIGVNIRYVSESGKTVPYDSLKLIGLSTALFDYDFKKELPAREYETVTVISGTPDTESGEP